MLSSWSSFVKGWFKSAVPNSSSAYEVLHLFCVLILCESTKVSNGFPISRFSRQYFFASDYSSSLQNLKGPCNRPLFTFLTSFLSFSLGSLTLSSPFLPLLSYMIILSRVVGILLVSILFTLPEESHSHPWLMNPVQDTYTLISCHMTTTILKL